jgi:repressor LexA
MNDIREGVTTNPTEPAGKIRPTKKQRELLAYIDEFIKEHGYSPSYREIMTGLNYTSVATVALHVNNLITRGHLRKRDRSARSLEVVSGGDTDMDVASDVPVKATQEKWLIDKVNAFITDLETAEALEPAKVDDIYVLIGALHVLGFDDAVRSFVPRLEALKTEG